MTGDKSPFGNKESRSVKELFGPDSKVGQKKDEGRTESHSPHPTFSVRFEFEGGTGGASLYGTMLGGPFYDPKRGIRCVMEAAYFRGWDEVTFGVWLITIEGEGLASLWHHLCESKQLFIREKADPEVRRIAVELFHLPGYSPEPKGAA